ncbi:hypothetical protein [Muriicola sp. Z0-33]|uniref:hypothetical protein n=1 Tax=Muriicola sp. Z0-33 TaxID=2816957 RepID=UPI00223784E7|nr:hypothetical protein [Muriicola sp. Z0-33]MCW5515617.1 hypothetical protein [Muriicola sp. Z0-33]
MRYLTVLILIITLGCKGHKNTANTNTNTPTVSEDLNLVLSDNYGGTDLEEVEIIRNSKRLKQFFLEINKTRKPGLPVPEIDFSKQLVVIYCSGKTTNSNIPGLFKVSESENRLVLGIKKENAIQENSPTALLLPFSLYTMPITDKEVVLESPN